MAIEKNSFKVARFDKEIHSPHTRDTLMSSDEDEDLQRPAAVDSDDDDEFDDCDSGAGSDDFDLLELGETGEEFCQAGDQTRSIPYELYDLHGLKDVLSMEVWNEVLTEEERFGLSKYLPDMDHENFVRTLKELFSGDNLHFGSPIDKLFEMMKGGLCEPRVALYRQGLIFLQRRKHYHNLRKHHNGMVNNLCQIRDAWMNCRGYSIDEKLRVLNIMRSQKSLMNENMEEFRSESSEREESKSGDALWEKKTNDWKPGKKTGRYSGYNVGPTPDITSHGRKTTVDSPANYGKRNPKGTLKLAGSIPTSMKDLAEPFPSTLHGVEVKSGRYGLGLPVPFYNNNKELGYDSSTAAWMYGQVLEEDGEPEMKVDGPTGSKMKKRKGTRAEDDMDSFMVTPVSSARNNLNALGRKQAINKLSDIKVLTAKPSYARDMYDGGKKVKYTENLQQISADNHAKFGKGQKSNLSLSSQRGTVDTNDPTWLSKQGRLFPTESISKPSDLYAKKNRGKMSREAVDLDPNDVFFHNEYRANSSQDKFHASSLYLSRDGAGNRGDDSTHSRSEDTESDSSEHINEDKDDNPLMRSKWAYPGGVRDLKSGPDMKNAQLLKRDKKNSYLTIDGSSQFSQRMEDYGENRDMMNSVQKGKMHDVGYSNIFPPEELDKNYFPGVIGADDRQQFYQLGRNGHVEEKHGDSLQMQSLKPSPLIIGKRQKGEVPHDFGLTQSNYMQNNNLEDDIYCTRPIVAHNGVSLKLGKKSQTVDLFSGHHPERPDVPLMGCDTLSKKRKVKNDLKTYMDPQDNKEYIHADVELQQGDDISYSRKRGKNKLAEDASDILENGVSQPPVMETETEEIEAEAKQQKKPFPLITPTVHSGFSFSIIHLLSSVRMAMITLLPEDSSESRKHLDKNDGEQGSKENKDNNQQEDINPNTDANTSEPSAQANVPSLTVQEIMNRVKSNPGDPCILETQEPLQDLVRGVLKIFSSRTAPLGAKGWKPLVIYQKPTKSWLWIGPAVSPNLSDSEPVEEVTSPDAWGVPHKMLVKLVDSFANWLKNSQETLQQIGSLPDPPLTLMQINLDEKERFKDLRAQKSLNTISSSSDEVKDYFRKEEVLRYLIPDRAFSYTAVDGKKSIVAPLRRCGGKPTSKARDHFMLKRDRPPHVTILCLVRDAASRLPGSIGTRADVCTLIRDSQYIVEDVSDTQVNQVVSGALDRLHYERDPCVQFDGERKLWVYLHRDREEEDFEDDGTSSTKKWRRQKKEVPEAGDVTVAYPGPPGESGFDLVSDLNVEALCVDDDNGGNDHVEDNKLLCRENSTNEDFVEDGFGGEPPV